MPLISVIVPIYNAEKTLRNCLDHLLAQSFQDFEVLLVNDGSRDGSAEICNEYCYKDPRFKYIEKENGGVSSARNAGIPHARGSYMTFADADDYALENWLSDCVPFMDGAGLVVAGAKTTGFNKDLPDYHPSRRRVSVSEALVELVDRKMLGYTWHKFYLTRIVQEKGLVFNTAFQPREDEEFLLRYLPHVREVQFVNSAQYVYDVPDFGNKYTPVSHEMLESMAQLLERASRDSKAAGIYRNQNLRGIIWSLRRGKMNGQSLTEYKKVCGLKGIWSGRASFGSKLFLSLPAAWAIRIFALEGKTINKGN